MKKKLKPPPRCLCQTKVSKVPIPKPLVDIDITKVQSPHNSKGQMKKKKLLLCIESWLVKRDPYI